MEKQPEPDWDEMEVRRGSRVPAASLIEAVKLAVPPQFEWVLFRHGTFIVFDEANDIVDLAAEATRLMEDYGPVHVGSPAGDFRVITLSTVEGWSVSGHRHDMYTYVGPGELDTNTPNDVEIGMVGRSKRDLDGRDPHVAFVSRSADTGNGELQCSP